MQMIWEPWCHRQILFEKAKRKTIRLDGFLFGSPNRARTCDIMINSHALYRLSYRGKYIDSDFLWVICVGLALSSRTASRRVFSAPHSLTSVFGMGTGGPYALWALTRFRCLLSFGFCLSLWQTSCFSQLCLSPLPFSFIESSASAFRIFLSFIFIRRESLVSYFSLSHYAIQDGQCPWCTFRDSNPGPTD